MIRFEIVTRDRLGITVEILDKIYNRKINLISMEVFFQKVCVKVDNMEEQVKKELMQEICNIKDVTSIKEMELLYYEQKEKKLKAIIESIEDREFKNIIGTSKAIERVKDMTVTIAKNNSTVLLRGESGTGKEVFAKAIHDISPRSSKNFIAINCASLPEALLESELFGYEQGSFTGAMIGGKDGIIKEANGGTLFLDEIGEMPISIQAKLLRVIQEGKIRKIGSNREEKIDVRIIAATNKNLEDMIKDKTFRVDLYYRLNVIPMYIPPLRDRIEDIPSFVKFFIDKLNYKLNKNINGAEIEFISELMNYQWPGNVRELQNVMERAMNLCKGDILTIQDLFITPVNHIYSNASKDNINEEGNEDLQLSLKDSMERCEKEIIEKAIKDYKTYRRAAGVLKVSHTTIMNKINKYSIKI
ncbi:MAG: sigma 54-interacting transcriptional regulator [Clostridium sp.]